MGNGSSIIDEHHGDQILESFHSTLHQRTNLVINRVAENVKGGSLSLDSLKYVTDSFVEADKQLAGHINYCKAHGILKNEDLADVVNDYFENSHQTVKLCNALEKCLKSARDNQLVIEAAVQQFEKEQGEGNGQGEIYSKLLDELKKFKAAGNPFAQEFISSLKSVYDHHFSTLNKMITKEKQIEEEKQNLNKATHGIFWTAVAGCVICSVVIAGLLIAPELTGPVLAATTEMVELGSVSVANLSAASAEFAELATSLAEAEAAAAAVAIPQSTVAGGAAAAGLSGIVVSWRVINSFWTTANNNGLNALKVRVKTELAIRAGIDELEAGIESMLKNAEGGGDLAIGAIKEELSKSRESIKELSEHTETCRKTTMSERKMMRESLNQLN